MASIRKRGQKQWQAQVRRTGYPPQSSTFTSRADAAAWVASMEADMAHGSWLRPGESETMTLREAAERYSSEVAANKSGSAQEKSVLRALASGPLGGRTLATIRGSDVAALRDEWRLDYESATVLRRLAVLSHVFSVAKREWGMEALLNPVTHIRKPSPGNARTRRIVDAPKTKGANKQVSKQAEIAAILSASGSDLLRPIAELALETAMRRGEIVGLTWDHVDLEKRTVYLPKTKNGDGRGVPLSTLAVSALKSVLPEAPGDRPGSGRVFQLRPDAVTRAFERALHRARKAYEQDCRDEGQDPDPAYLVDLRFHDLRHEATTRLAEIFPLHELTKITGHRDPRMLMRYYHPKAEDLARKLA